MLCLVLLRVILGVGGVRVVVLAVVSSRPSRVLVLLFLCLSSGHWCSGCCRVIHAEAARSSHMSRHHDVLGLGRGEGERRLMIGRNSLRWREPIHFRMAEICMNDHDTYRSFWAAEDMPEALHRHYDQCNLRDPVGAPERGDIT